MKSSILYVFICTILIAVFPSCNENSTSNNSCNQGIGTSFQIPDHEGIRCINKYKDDATAASVTIKDSLGSNPYDKIEPFYGAKVNLFELREILNMANCEKDELYAMLAVMPNDSTEVVFALKSNTVKDDDPTTPWIFFDFTNPCPTSCPNF